MDKTGIIVCAVVGALGLLSAILGFIAEASNPFSFSPALGICASLFLLAAEITISVVGGCCGCCKSRAIPSETNRIVGIVSAVFSWILAVVALVLFLYGASLNDIGLYIIGLHAGGGVLTLAATALGITSFLMLRGETANAAPEAASQTNGTSQQQQQPVVIMVGQPQVSPTEAAGAPKQPGGN